jgi:hypothetical protein
VGAEEGEKGMLISTNGESISLPSPPIADHTRSDAMGESFTVDGGDVIGVSGIQPARGAFEALLARSMNQQGFMWALRDVNTVPLPMSPNMGLSYDSIHPAPSTLSLSTLQLDTQGGEGEDGGEREGMRGDMEEGGQGKGEGEGGEKDRDREEWRKRVICAVQKANKIKTSLLELLQTDSRYVYMAGGWGVGDGI